MEYTQFAIFEVGNDCNLKNKHDKCPCMERYQENKNKPLMTDDMIVDNAVKLYQEYGFKGLIGFHYYNEPLLYIDRIRRLVDRIKARIDKARFVLWTNGALLPDDCNELSFFDKAWVTNYDGGNYARIRNGIPDTKIVSWQLDNRKKRVQKESDRRCRRIFSEIIFDAFGQCHICCVDWKGECKVGNLFTDELESIIYKFKAIRKSIAHDRMTDDAPVVCKRCLGRHNNISALVPEVAAEANRMLKQRPPKPPTGLLSIICLNRFNELVPDDWIKKHLFADHVTIVKSELEAQQAMRRNKTTWAVILKPSDVLEGNVVEAIKLHPNENTLTCKVFDKAGNECGERKIFQVRQMRKLHVGQPVMKRPNNVDMQELKVVSSVESQSKLAVVFVHYNLPEHRLKDHFKWNNNIYRESGAKVFVVSDKKYDVPDYARCIVYPEEMKVFNLAKTSNYGIRAAIESGYQTIIKTDADMVFPHDTFENCMKVNNKHAVVPIYYMASNYENRNKDYVEAPRATGTIAMTAEGWKQAHFHEGCEGYGSDDAILLKAIVKAKIQKIRDSIIYHIAHIEGTPQKEFDSGNPRIDHWNRDSGFNPENFAHNGKLMQQADIKNDNWGLASLTGATIVITHYKMPEQRLYDFFKWNDALFKQYNCRVIVVSDKDHSNLPGYARVAIFPEEMQIFNLAKTSNYGIRLAGSGIVCKTDPDCVFSEQAMQELHAVTEDNGLCYRYRMADSFETKEKAKTWDASKGTMVLHYNHWEAISGYDERQNGYGIEDGDAYHRAGQLTPGKSVRMSVADFWHIAHSMEKQTFGNTRKDCWNRDNGFNPRNHAHNQNVRASGKWQCKTWGLVA